jgi:hypothetical protein
MRWVCRVGAILILTGLVSLAGCGGPAAQPAKNPAPASTERGTQLLPPVPTPQDKGNGP